MFSVSIISIFFGVVFLAVLKKLHEVVKHYQRPNHFPPGPSQVQYKNKFNVITKCFKLENYIVLGIKIKAFISQSFLGAYLRKYTFTSKDVSQQKRLTHASHLQIYGRYIRSTIRAIFRTKTDCNRFWCKAIEGDLQIRLCNQFFIK